jgi:hypothetical protein
LSSIALTRMSAPTITATTFSGRIETENSASTFTVALSLFGMSIAAANSDERKFNWNCVERGGYAYSVDDVGRGSPTGNPLNGTNRLLFTVSMGADNNNAHFLLSAYIDNKLVPQMFADDEQVINIKFDSDYAPISIRAIWLDISGAEYFLIEKSAHTWRFVHTTSDIFDESIAKETLGPPKRTVFIDAGDCVLNP